MGIRMMERVMDLPNDQISRWEKWVLTALANYADDRDGTRARPSSATLARKTNFSRSQVKRLLDQLERRGFIALEARSAQHRAKSFRLTLPEGSLDEPSRSAASTAPEGSFQTPEGSFRPARGVIAMTPDPCIDPCTDPKSSGAAAPPSLTSTTPNDDEVRQLGQLADEVLEAAPAAFFHQQFDTLTRRAAEIGLPGDRLVIQHALESALRKREQRAAHAETRRRIR